MRARSGAPGVNEFFDGGRQAATELQAALAAAGRSLDQFDSVLDFGCGAGRVLPWMAAVASRARCAGCDVDPAAIAWATEHHPELGWTISGPKPPLPFSDASHSLLYSISVFSHLAEADQDSWLAELQRVLTTGGVALLSVHGEYAFEQFRSGRVRSGWCAPGAFARDALDDEEFLFVPYRRSRWNRGDLPGVAPEYGLAFHGRGYVTKRWSGMLAVEAVLPRAITGWQDIVVCAR